MDEKLPNQITEAQLEEAVKKTSASKNTVPENKTITYLIVLVMFLVAGILFYVFYMQYIQLKNTSVGTIQKQDKTPVQQVDTKPVDEQLFDDLMIETEKDLDNIEKELDSIENEITELENLE